MAQAGDVIHHPITGEKIVFIQTAVETKGEFMRMHLFVQPHGFVAAAHVHPGQEERFSLVAGRLGLEVDGKERTLTAGEEVVVPRGAPHRWWNAGDEEVHIVGEVRPALSTERFFETFFGLARDGKTNPKTGLPGLLQLAVLAQYFRDEIYLARPPLAVQRVLFGMLAPIGRLRGYRAIYLQYSSDLASADKKSKAA